MPRGSRKRSTSKRARKRSTRRATSKSKKASRTRKRSKGRSPNRHTKQEKLVEAVLKQSPYNVMGLDTASTKLELFGKYKPMKPMSYYQSAEYPFYPGSNASGLLSGLVNPLKKATTDEPYLSRLLDLNRKTMNLVEGSTTGTSADPLKVLDTRPPPFLGSSGDKSEEATGASSIAMPSTFVGGAALMGDYASVLGSMFPQLGLPGMSVPLYSDPRARRRFKTLDEMTYTIDQDEENKGVIAASNYLAVKDTDGIDPSKNYLFAKKR